MNRSPGPLRTTAAALTVCALLVTGASPAAAMEPTPGSAGIGDPYFPRDGNGGYDVTHYTIDDKYSFALRGLSGRTTVQATATQELSRFNLDLVLTPTAVTVDGAPAGFEHDGHELQVTPETTLGEGAAFTVVVDYRGRPGRIEIDGETPWATTGREVAAVNEPHIAPWWFAANDHPRDKATYDITISVPEGNRAISNGERVSETTSDGWTTSHWEMTQPMATYLAFFVAGKFQFQEGTRQGLPYVSAVSQERNAQFQKKSLRSLRRSPVLIRWMEPWFGPYPFTSTGGVVTAQDLGFALENQSRPVYSNYPPGTDLLVHELAHQWFGNSVSVDRWRDIWLNEGLASFVTILYQEEHGGVNAQRWLKKVYDQLHAGDSFWDIRISNPGKGDIFDWAVYMRGAMTVQALRHRIGEKPFRRLLLSWVEENTNGTATVGEFRTLAEATSGEDLDGFFDAWLNARRKPARTAANGLG